MIRPNARIVRQRDRDRSGDDRLNRAFHELLQEAAAKREERQRVHSLRDASEAAQESADLLSLARRSSAPEGDLSDARKKDR